MLFITSKHVYLAVTEPRSGASQLALTIPDIPVLNLYNNIMHSVLTYIYANKVSVLVSVLYANKVPALLVVSALYANLLDCSYSTLGVCAEVLVSALMARIIA